MEEDSHKDKDLSTKLRQKILTQNNKRLSAHAKNVKSCDHVGCNHNHK